MKKLSGNKMLATCFILVITVIGSLNATQISKLALSEISALINKDFSQMMSPTVIEEKYSENFFGRFKYINVNGLTRRLLNQRIVNGTVRATDDYLYFESDVNYRFSKKESDAQITKATNILTCATNIGAETLYVQRPGKFNEQNLPYQMTIERNKEYAYWYNKMSEIGFETLDLRAYKGTLSFYKTDHHWTGESAFEAARIISEKLSIKGVEILEKNHYKQVCYKDSFLGSEGVKTGELYVGKDDFVFLQPTFEVSMSLIHYINGEKDFSSKGDWRQTFIDEKILNNKDYYNKYNAFLRGGYVESIIENKGNNNGKKLLVISDSYARPMMMYLSLMFKETRYLDPQVGRYNNSYIEYIEQFQPDVVVMMYTGDFVKE